MQGRSGLALTAEVEVDIRLDVLNHVGFVGEGDLRAEGRRGHAHETAARTEFGHLLGRPAAPVMQRAAGQLCGVRGGR